MELVKISDEISCLPASAPPLSADVGVISDENAAWIFDVGSNDKALELVNGIKCEKRIVLSHFHADHTENLRRIKINENDKIYGGNFTCKKFGSDKIEITIVDKDLYFNCCGGKIHLFPIPSAHAKGCVGLEFKDFAFLGDSVYCEVKNGKAVYNAGQLQSLIRTLKSLSANKFLVSHNEHLECNKQEEIAKLEKIYSLRKKNEPYIYLK